MIRTIARLPVAGFVVALAAALAPVSPEQSATPSIVRMHVAVTDASGAPVAGLTRDDFLVSIDDGPATVEAFDGPASPMSLLFLVDVSRSMPNYTDMKDEIERSIVPAVGAADRVRVGGIANRLQLAPAFSSDPKEIVRTGKDALSFRKEDRTGPTPLWDAMDAAVTALENEQGLRAIILVTDGRSTGNRVGFRSALERAITSGVVVQVLSDARELVIRQTATSFAKVRPDLSLELLTSQTGGLMLEEKKKPEDDRIEPGPLLTRMVKDLRGMYTLGVAAPGPRGSVHRIGVRVGRAGLSVRTRPAFQTK